MLLSCSDCGTHHHAGDVCPTCSDAPRSSRSSVLGPLPKIAGATLIGTLMAACPQDVYGAPPEEDVMESGSDAEGSGDATMQDDVAEGSES